MWNDSNFLTNCIFKLFNRLRAITVYLWLEVSPREKNRTDLNQVCQIILPDPVYVCVIPKYSPSSYFRCVYMCLITKNGPVEYLVQVRHAYINISVWTMYLILNTGLFLTLKKTKKKDKKNKTKPNIHNNTTCIQVYYPLYNFLLII